MNGLSHFWGSRSRIYENTLPIEWGQSSNINVSKRYRTVVALEHDGISGRFRNVERGAGRPGHFDVLVNDHAVMKHFEEHTVLGLASHRVESRGTESDLKRLPLTRRV